MRKYEITLVGFNEAIKVFTMIGENPCLALENLFYPPVGNHVLDREKEAITQIHIEEIS